MAGAPNGFRYKNNTHILGISIHFFQKDVAAWPKWTHFDRRHRGDFTRRQPYALYRCHSGFGPPGILRRTQCEGMKCYGR